MRGMIVIKCWISVGGRGRSPSSLSPICSHLIPISRKIGQLFYAVNVVNKVIDAVKILCTENSTTFEATF